VIRTVQRYCPASCCCARNCDELASKEVSGTSFSSVCRRNKYSLAQAWLMMTSHMILAEELTNYVGLFQCSRFTDTTSQSARLAKQLVMPPVNLASACCVQSTTSVFRRQSQHANRSGIQGWASECPDVKNYKWRLNLVWHRKLHSCTHMATVSVKGLRRYVKPRP